jgi:hypothetical protein
MRQLQVRLLGHFEVLVDSRLVPADALRSGARRIS